MNDKIYELMRIGLEFTNTYKNKKELVEIFAAAINKYSLENDSNTPDFILAEYLYDCLQNANLIIGRRSVWYNPENK
jgi:hypothetical protein